MTRQRALNLPVPNEKERSLSETVAAVLKKYGPTKRVVLARQLECSESHLSEVINGQKHWPQEWLDYIAKNYDFEAEIAAHFAAKRGLRVTARRTMPDKEWKRRVAYALAQHNGIGKLILEEAMALDEDVWADAEDLP
jgi:plasmid maintenance system antidote protein VapI